MRRVGEQPSSTELVGRRSFWAVAQPSAYEPARVIMFRSAIGCGVVCAGVMWSVITPEENVAQEPWHVSSEPWFSVGSVGEQGSAAFGSVVGAVRVGTDAIAIADGLNYQVSLFGLDGQHLWTQGRFGEGPGEFHLITAIGRCPSGSIAIYDQSLARLTAITSEGTVDKTQDVLDLLNVSVPPRAMTCGAGAAVFLERPSFMAPPEGVGPRVEQSGVTVVSSGGQLARLGDYPSERYFYGHTDGPRLFGKVTLIAA